MNRGLSASWKKTAAERDANVGAFLQLAPDLGEAGMSAAPAATGALAGAPFAVKDNIAVRGFQLSCGSKLLEGFLSPYSATCVERLVAAGAVPVGKTNCDEFGMGSSTENSAYRKTVNPWDASRVPGGSSGGSAAAVAAGIVPFALGSDTGGSVRQPAAFCGVYGLKPTWGAVSRYGLVAYASSLDVVGVVAKTVAFARAAFVVDARRRPPRPLLAGVAAGRAGRARFPRGPRLAHRHAARGRRAGLHPDVASALRAAADRLRSLGHEVVEAALPSLEHVVAAYYVIATAEASANLARFDGVRYGRRAPDAINPERLVIASRSAGFGNEVKQRILLGTYVLRSGFQDQYYLQALKVRTLIRRDFERCFGPGRGPPPPARVSRAPVRPGQRGCRSLRAEARRRVHLLGEPRGVARPGVPRRGRARPAHRHAADRPRVRRGPPARHGRGAGESLPVARPAGLPGVRAVDGGASACTLRRSVSRSMSSS